MENIRIKVSLGKYTRIMIFNKADGLSQLIQDITDKFCIIGEFYLEYFVEDFGCNALLESCDDIQNLSSITIIMKEDDEVVPSQNYMKPFPYIKDENTVTNNLLMKEKTILKASETCFVNVCNSATIKEETISNNSKDSFSFQTQDIGNASTESNSPIIEENDSSKISDKNTWHLRYSLPKFPVNVERLLKGGNNLSSVHKDVIITKIYEQISPLANFYPKKAQYDMVVATLLDVHPSLNDDSLIGASKFDFWKRKLVNKFRNKRSVDGVGNPTVQYRKLKKKVDGRQECKTSVPVKSKCTRLYLIENYLPSYTIEESETMALNYKELLREELMQINPDPIKITHYMNKTFALRRKEIVMHGMTINDIMDSYPCLRDKVQILFEMKRIMGQVEIAGIQNFIKNAASFYSGITLVLRERKKDTLKSLLTKINYENDPERCYELKAEYVLKSIPALLREDINKVVCRETDMINKTSPFIDEDSLKVFVEGVEVADCSNLSHAIYIYNLIFYIFNIESNLKNSEEFIQFFFLKMTNIKLSTICSNLHIAISDKNIL